MITIETSRMSLRQLTIEDVFNLMGILADPIAMKYYPWVLDETGTKEWIQRNLDRYAQHDIGLWAAELKDGGEFIGQIGLIPTEIEGIHEIEIGYLLLRNYWGKGYATEGALACKDYAFNELGLNRVVITIRPENTPSRKVAEKLGAKFEREYNKMGLVHFVYVLEKYRTRDGFCIS